MYVCPPLDVKYASTKYVSKLGNMEAEHKIKQRLQNAGIAGHEVYLMLPLEPSSLHDGVYHNILVNGGLTLADYKFSRSREIYCSFVHLLRGLAMLHSIKVHH